jgi:hypothetical protein
MVKILLVGRWLNVGDDFESKPRLVKTPLQQ